jgi:hypothetical protein
VNSSSGPRAHVTADGIGLPWIKSSYSGPTGGNCVEVAVLDGGQVAMRNSRQPDGAVLIFTAAEWSAFLEGARDGEFGTPS